MAFVNKIGNILKQARPSISNASIYQAVRCFSSSKLFVGGVSFETDENSLREAFVPYGDVIEARIIVDRETGRSRGFGFISYPSVEEASAAIQALDGRDLHGRFIRVAYAADQRGASRRPQFSSSTGGPVDGYGYSGNAHSDRDAGHYDTSRGGANSFSNTASYNGMGQGQEHVIWPGHDMDNNGNFSREDSAGGYVNARNG